MNNLAILTDLDGTLIDSYEANYLSYRQAFLDFGVEVSEEVFSNKIFGKNKKDFIPDILKSSNSQASYEKISSKKNEYYRMNKHKLSLNQGLFKLLKGIRGSLSLGLVTNASNSNVDFILDHFGLTNFFDIVVTGDHVSKHKPDPMIYSYAAEALNVRPDNCFVFEDSPEGIASATLFGATVFKVTI